MSSTTITSRPVGVWIALGLAACLAWGRPCAAQGRNMARPAVAKPDLSRLTPEKLQTLNGHRQDVWRLAFNPREPSILVSCGDDSQVITWDLQTGRPMEEVKILDHKVRDLAFDETGRFFAVATTNPWEGGFSGLLRIRDAAEGTMVEIKSLQRWTFRSVAVDPKGVWMAAGGDSRALRVWKLARPVVVPDDRGEPKLSYFELPTPPALPNEILTVDVHGGRQNPIIAVGGKEGMLKVFKIKNDRLIETPITTADAPGEMRSVKFHPQADFLATGGASGVVRLWDLDKGTPTQRFDAQAMGVNDMAFSPDGSLLAVAHDSGHIRLWDIETGKEVAKLEAHKGGALAVAFSRDGRSLATGGRDFSVSVWRLFPIEARKKKS
ncbi:WD40 repeat domain-containing protein [Paludisphaera rhizosphaerae]|uniref:WD40 repeat domain-containing protein n=1 Tax=Paludisphaera rhizosphaerae TaxID=2711216 RepID=UPI0013EE25C7|nr:WD40 repeat domain-containing protein [Paludisphaera rhizosphaerae]